MSTYCISFSPAGSTQGIARTVAGGLGGAVQEINITTGPFAARDFAAGDAVVVAVPVYGGRVPAAAAERLRLFTGNGAKAVALAVYGNRHYDDALLELCDLLQAQGFCVAAAGAFVAQHSIVGAIGQGRPNAGDTAELQAFADRAAALLQSELPAISVPGNSPYKELSRSARTIEVSDACIGCGICASHCPVEAIPADDCKQTDAERCIGCMSCINRCPQQARSLPAPMRRQIEQYLSQYAEPRKNEVYFAE